LKKFPLHNFSSLTLDPKLFIWQMPYPGIVMGLGVGLTGGKGVPCVKGSSGATATFCNEEVGNSKKNLAMTIKQTHLKCEELRGFLGTMCLSA
jgi:hypothetical protein